MLWRTWKLKEKVEFGVRSATLLQIRVVEPEVGALLMTCGSPTLPGEEPAT